MVVCDLVVFVSRLIFCESYQGAECDQFMYTTSMAAVRLQYMHVHFKNGQGRREGGGPGGLLTLGPVIKYGARAVRLVFFVCCVIDVLF